MSRVKILTERYSTEAVKRAISVKDPSNNRKYLEWIIKCQQEFPSGSVSKGEELNRNTTLESCLKFFHTNQSRLTRKDIYTYTLPGLSKEIATLGKSKHSIEKESRENSEKVYESDNWLVIYPTDRAAMMQYGRGSKWCITDSKSCYFEEYTEDGARFYVVQNKKDAALKFCVAVNEENDCFDPLNVRSSVYTATNKEICARKLLDTVKDKKLTNAILFHAINSHPSFLTKMSEADFINLVSVTEIIDWLEGQHPITVGYVLKMHLYNYLFNVRDIYNLSTDYERKMAKLLGCLEHWRSSAYIKKNIAEFLVKELEDKASTKQKINWNFVFCMPTCCLPFFASSPDHIVREQVAKRTHNQDCLAKLLADPVKVVVESACKNASKKTKMQAVANKVKYAYLIKSRCPTMWFLTKAKPSKKSNSK